MKFILKISIPIERGNELLRDPLFGKKMSDILSDVKAEAAYFGTVCNQRGGYIIVNMTDASQIPAIAEPFFLYMHASVEAIPVMELADLQKAGPAIGAIVQKWG